MELVIVTLLLQYLRFHRGRHHLIPDHLAECPGTHIANHLDDYFRIRTLSLLRLFPHHVLRTLDGSLQISGQYRFSYLCLRFVWLPRQRRRTTIQKLHVARHRLAALHPNHRLRRRLPYCRTFNPALFLFPIQNATCEGTKKKNDFSSVMEISHMQIPY